MRQVEVAIAEANRPELSRRERRKACKWLAKELGVPLDRILIPKPNGHPGYTCVESQIEHHKAKAERRR